jgi:NAD(P)-dependent dehydrogenase (short-subunit alcohol dehydrogenase family)
MQGMVVVVTGANGGLGSYVTRAFLDAGATVAGTSKTIQQSDFAQPAFLAILADVATQKGASELINQVVTKFGKLQVLVHTVGGFAGGQPVADTDDATMQKMMDTNFNSLFQVARAAIPALRASGDGRLIAIGSRAAVDPGPGVGAYSASKAAMVSLVGTIAAENRDAGLRANVILPGTIDTPANRKGMPSSDFTKWVRPAAIASLILWLAGDSGKDMNGAAIPIYGGDI